MSSEAEEIKINYADPRAEAMARVVTGAREARAESMEGEDEIIIGEELPPKEVETVEGDIEEVSEEKESIENSDYVEEPEVKKVDNTPNLDDIQIIERDGQKFMQLTLKGERRDLSLPEAQALMQKYANADRATREAAETQRQYQQKLNELQNAQPAQQNPPTPLARDARPGIDAEEQKRTVRNAFQTLYDEGNVSEAADIFNDLLGKLNQPVAQPVQQQGLTVQDVKKYTAETYSALEDHRELTSAWKQFSTNPKFVKVVSDDTLKQKLDQLTGELQDNSLYMATNPSYADIFEKAGEMTLEWVDRLTGQPTAPKATTPAVDEIVDHKRSAVGSVTSRTARRGPPPEVKPQTSSDIISEMKKRRGQVF